MRVEDIHLRATSVRLPSRLRIDDAVAAGDCPPGLATATGAVSVSYSPDESAAEMAAPPPGRR